MTENIKCKKKASMLNIKKYLVSKHLRKKFHTTSQKIHFPKHKLILRETYANQEWKLWQYNKLRILTWIEASENIRGLSKYKINWNFYYFSPVIILVLSNCCYLFFKKTGDANLIPLPLQNLLWKFATYVEWHFQQSFVRCRCKLHQNATREL